MNLFTKRFSIALSVLSPLFACASEQPVYEIGDGMNISDFKTIDHLHHALVCDNELAENCLHEDKRGKKAAHTVAMQVLPHESKQLKKDFVRYSQTLDEDFFREGIDQELDRREEQAKKKKRIDAQQAMHIEYVHKMPRPIKSQGLDPRENHATHAVKMVSYHLSPPPPGLPSCS